MATLVTDPYVEKQIRAERAASDADRYDEVWDGVYMMSPLPNPEHQALVAGFIRGLASALGSELAECVLPGVNVSDRLDDWKENYRCPDVTVYLPGNPARLFAAHYQGGPDFLVEIVSADDHSYRKLPFYGTVGVREVLSVDRNPWKLELYRADNKSLQLVGRSDLDTTVSLQSNVLPVSFRLVSGENRPRVEISRIDGAACWLI